MNIESSTTFSPLHTGVEVKKATKAISSSILRFSEPMTSEKSRTSPYSFYSSGKEFCASTTPTTSVEAVTPIPQFSQDDDDDDDDYGEITESSKDISNDWHQTDLALRAARNNDWDSAERLLNTIHSVHWKDNGFGLCASLAANAAIDEGSPESMDRIVRFYIDILPSLKEGDSYCVQLKTN